MLSAAALALAFVSAAVGGAAQDDDATPNNVMKQLRSTDTRQQLSALRAMEFVISNSTATRHEDVAATMADMFGALIFELVGNGTSGRDEVQRAAGDLLHCMASAGTRAVESLVSQGAIPSLVEAIDKDMGSSSVGTLLGSLRTLIASQGTALVDDFIEARGVPVASKLLEYYANDTAPILALTDGGLLRIGATAIDLLARTSPGAFGVSDDDPVAVQERFDLWSDHVADDLVDYDAVTKLSPLLLAADPVTRLSAAGLMYMALTATGQVANWKGRPETLPVGLARIVAASVVPNAMAAYHEDHWAKGLDGDYYFLVVRSACDYLIKDGNEMQQAHAVHNGCVELSCEEMHKYRDAAELPEGPQRSVQLVQSRGTILALGRVLSRESASLTQRVKDIIIETPGCLSSIAEIAKYHNDSIGAQAKKILASVSLHDGGMHPSVIDQLEGPHESQQLRAMERITASMNDGSDETAAGVADLYGSVLLHLAVDFENDEVRRAARDLLQQVAEMGSQAADVLVRVGAISGLATGVQQAMGLGLMDVAADTFKLLSDVAVWATSDTSGQNRTLWVDEFLDAGGVSLVLDLLDDHDDGDDDDGVALTKAATWMLAFAVNVHGEWKGLEWNANDPTVEILSGRDVLMKLSSLLLSSDTDIRNNSAGTLTATLGHHILNGKRPDVTSIIDAAVLPNTFTAYRELISAKKDKSSAVFGLMTFTCINLLAWGNETERTHAVEYQCVERVTCAMVMSWPARHHQGDFILAPALKSIEDIITNGTEALSTRVKDLIIGRSGCQESIHKLTEYPTDAISKHAKAIVNAFNSTSMPVPRVA